MTEWTFITNPGAVLALIAQRNQITAREIAETLGITERPVRRIIAELEAAGYLCKQKIGRVNPYRVNLSIYPGLLPLEGHQDSPSVSLNPS